MKKTKSDLKLIKDKVLQVIDYDLKLIKDKVLQVIDYLLVTFVLFSYKQRVIYNTLVTINTLTLNLAYISIKNNLLINLLKLF